MTTEVYVGLDLHKETVHGTALNKEGDVICSCRFPATKEGYVEFFKSFHIGNTLVAMEACGMWRGCNKILQELGFRAKLANAYKVHQFINENKTDKKDSRLIADLLRIGYLPEVYLPSDEIIKIRDLSRHRCCLVDERVKIQSQIKHTLIREGIPYKDIWNKEGIDWLKSLNKTQITDLTEIYEEFIMKEKAAKKEIGLFARRKNETALLMAIPGIAEVSATIIYSEIGDINRFSSEKKLHAYAGIAPGRYQSGDKSVDIPRKAVNKTLKWILMECAGIAILKPNIFQKCYFALEKKKGWKIARKAVARKILSIVWHILKENVPYKES